MHELYQTLQEELKRGQPVVVVTVISTKGSVPRKIGAKMLVRHDGSLVGTIGGGKFESLVIDACKAVLEKGELETRSFPLHERADDSFGAICGGEVTVLMEPHQIKERIIISGAGHCGQALAELAINCGRPVVIFDTRKELCDTPLVRNGYVKLQTDTDALDRFVFSEDDCVVLVSKGHLEDRAALRSILLRDPIPSLAYLGMIGSDRKVSMVMKDLKEEGISETLLEKIYAPIGLDIGSESPAEIAVSILAEILKVTRGARGGHLRR